MNKLVVISGGFHPFHTGHASLYQEAKKAFPDAQVVIGATNSQKDRPFPFKIKQKLAQVSGVPPKDFVEVSRQFSGEDPAIASRIKNPNNTILIFARSEKDKGEAPLPAKPDPATGKLPLVTRGPNKGKPVSNYLQYLDGNEDNLKPMTQHAYMAYLPTIEFGPGITSASEFRELWNKLTKVLVNPKSTPEQKEKAKELKKELVMNMYPATQKNPKLAATVVKLLDAGMGVETQELDESTSKDSTLRAVVNDISEPIASVYNNMLMQAEKYVDNHGALDKGFRLIVAGIGGRWTQNMYINKLKNELYDLCKVYPSQTNDLKDFLSGKEKHGVVDMHKSFSIIAKELPVILERLGRHINSPELSKAAKRWEHNREVYKDYVRDNWDSEEIEVTPPVKKQKSNIIGQQNAVVDKIINDVLAKIKPSDAGSIRNTLANVPINNRLNALQKILSDMNMTVNEKMKMGATIEPIEESNISESLDYLEEK